MPLDPTSEGEMGESETLAGVESPPKKTMTFSIGSKKASVSLRISDGKKIAQETAFS